MRVVIKFIFKIFAIIMYRPKILGKENLPEEGGALLCPNHVHNLDAAIIVAMFKRKVNVLAKEELFKNKFLCWIADLFGIYPVKREKADMQAIKISLKLLKKDLSQERRKIELFIILCMILKRNVFYIRRFKNEKY